MVLDKASIPDAERFLFAGAKHDQDPLMGRAHQFAQSFLWGLPSSRREIGAIADRTPSGGSFG
jgi:hypothetical protein